MAPVSCHSWSFRTASCRVKPDARGTELASMCFHLCSSLVVDDSNDGDLLYLYTEYFGVTARISSNRNSSCALRRPSASTFLPLSRLSIVMEETDPDIPLF